MLERRYGIATNNVPVDAVQNVEIIENHQPVQTLRDAVLSDKAAVSGYSRKTLFNTRSLNYPPLEK